MFLLFLNMCARVYRVKCFDFSSICIRIRTDFFVCVCVFCVFMFYGLKPEINAFIHSLYIKIGIRRMRILINSITSLKAQIVNEVTSGKKSCA